MKFLTLTLILTLGFGFSAYAQEEQDRKILVNNVDILTWPQDLSALAVIDIYIEIMKADPETNSFLNQVNKELQDHGIKSVKDIFQFCPGEVKSNATAFFSQDTRIVDTRVLIPGLPEPVWTDLGLAAQKKAYSSKVIKTRFIEYLAVSDRPQICMHKGEQLISGYDTVVHEMAHFLLQDPNYYYEELLTPRLLPDFVQMTVFRKGGELDAFKIGSSAGSRFYRKNGLEVSTGEYAFIGADGKISDEEGFKNYVIQTYANYYNNSDTVSGLKKSKLQMVEWMLLMLKINEPSVKSLKSEEINKSYSNEISVLENLKSQLQ